MLNSNLHDDPGHQPVGGTLCLWLLCLAIIAFKCTPHQLQVLEESAFGATECGFHASLACAAQESARCGKREQGADWEGYAQCLADHSGTCVTSGLAKCAMASIVKTTGALFAGGSSGCNADQERESVRQCIEEARPVSERSAVEVAASCYVDACEED